MKYQIAIVEDDLMCTNRLKEHIDKFTKLHKFEFEVSVFKDGSEIVEDYKPRYDIIFLDIEMEKLNGLETAEIIRTHDKEVIIIFVTNMVNYAVKGYTVDALSYLLKPVSFFTFERELNKSIDRLRVTNRYKTIAIQTKDGIRKLSSNEIMFIESIQHDLIIHTDKEEIIVRDTLKKYENNLKDFNFNRANNCYLINLLFVSTVRNDYAIVGNHELKISRSRKKQFMDELMNYLGEML